MADGQIVVSGLTKVYKNVRAVDNLSFVVEPGRVTGFLGPNGAGKTTTLRMVLNLVTPNAGTATIGGRRYADLPEPIRHVGGDPGGQRRTPRPHRPQPPAHHLPVGGHSPGPRRRGSRDRRAHTGRGTASSRAIPSVCANGSASPPR